MLPQKLMKAASVIILALLAQISFAQDRVITGKVTDSKDGSPIADQSQPVSLIRISRLP